MNISKKEFEFEKHFVKGIPALSCFAADKRTEPKPLIILSHAFQSTKAYWQDKLPDLAASGYFAVAMDNKGHGERNGPDFKSQVFTKHGFNLYEVRRLIKETADDIPILIDHYYAKMPEKLRFIQEENSGHEFTESMWQNITK